MIDPEHTCPFRTHILLGHANFPQEFEDFVGPPLLAPPKPTSAVPLIRWIRRKQSTGKADTITSTPHFANGGGGGCGSCGGGGGGGGGAGSGSANSPGTAGGNNPDKVPKTSKNPVAVTTAVVVR